MGDPIPLDSKTRTHIILVHNAHETLAALADSNLLGDELWVLPWVQGYMDRTERPELNLKLSSRVYVYREENDLITVAEIYSIKGEHRRTNILGRLGACFYLRTRSSQS